jgi:prepilin-type N-terminal cleavage/methylation domain-containing protein
MFLFPKELRLLFGFKQQKEPILDSKKLVGMPPALIFRCPMLHGQGRSPEQQKENDAMSKKGFTLVEIMIVVAIIGLLAAIAIPSFVKARNTSRQNACINNLRQIDSAKEQWALANNKGDTDAVSTTDVQAYMKDAPTCPGGGTYTYNPVGTDPACSVTEHGI